MIKNIKIKEKIEYTLEEKDINTITQCLNYCYHRLHKHKCGISGIVNLKELYRIRKEFGIVKNKEPEEIDYYNGMVKKSTDNKRKVEEINYNINSLIDYIFNINK